MKKIIFTLFVIFSLNSKANTITIEGEAQRVKMMEIIGTGYLAGQGKISNFNLISGAGLNDPTGKTLGKTNGTWVKVTHNGGFYKFIQISNDMLNKMNGIINDPTSNIAYVDLINHLCATQSSSFKMVLNQVQAQATTTAQNEKIVYVDRVVDKPSYQANDFEVAPTNSCELANLELSKLETLYAHANKETLRKHGFQNKKELEQAMVNLAVLNPGCLDLKIQKKNNTWVWIGAGVATVLLADLIEGNGIDGFGLFNKPSKPSNSTTVNGPAGQHTEPNAPPASNLFGGHTPPATTSVPRTTISTGSAVGGSIISVSSGRTTFGRVM